MKKLFLTLSFFLIAASAIAGVKLHNKDSQSYDLKVTCGSGSTVVRSIQSSTITDLGTGPCTVVLTDSGDKAEGDNGDTLTIKGGKIGK